MTGNCLKKNIKNKKKSKRRKKHYAKNMFEHNL